MLTGYSTILASNAQCRDAAANWLATEVPGLVKLDAPELAGEAQQMAQKLVKQICQHKAGQGGADKTFGIVSGGETVVSMDSATAGRGGRSELALAFVSNASGWSRGTCQLGGIGREPMAVTGQLMPLVGS